MEPIKESTRSTIEEQRRKATCSHDWKKCEGYLFGNKKHVVHFKCSICGTYKRKRKAA